MGNCPPAYTICCESAFTSCLTCSTFRMTMVSHCPSTQLPSDKMLGSLHQGPGNTASSLLSSVTVLAAIIESFTRGCALQTPWCPDLYGTNVQPLLFLSWTRTRRVSTLESTMSSAHSVSSFFRTWFVRFVPSDRYVRQSLLDLKHRHEQPHILKDSRRFPNCSSNVYSCAHHAN